MEFFLSLCKTLQTDVTRKHTYGTVSVSEQLLVDLQLWPGVGPTQRIRNSHIPVWTSWWSTLETPTQRASPHWSLRTSWARQWTASSDHTSPANTFRESNKVRVLEWLYSVTFGRVWSRARLTLRRSLHCVNMTMMGDFSCRTIFQKSLRVSGSGPWVAMYSLLCLYPWRHKRKLSASHNKSHMKWEDNGSGWSFCWEGVSCS